MEGCLVERRKWERSGGIDEKYPSTSLLLSYIYIYIYINEFSFVLLFFNPSNILILNKVQNIDIQGQFCIFKKDIYSTASFHSNL